MDGDVTLYHSWSVLRQDMLSPSRAIGSVVVGLPKGIRYL